jgi:hypothetical protein
MTRDSGNEEHLKSNGTVLVDGAEEVTFVFSMQGQTND